ncbi:MULTISPECIES: DegT/DnrJ/EryC1/StrS family aminotransferase [Helcococcus]|uniref:DegT/DnrJ/EryC1/StrS family aminotransferase n=1 Tax=Helcococcus bovis TaxID=3153252 RepID=A0ABW9F420_9FIRM
MKKLNVQFSPPDISEKEIEQVVEALKSGWITTGPKTKEFERRIASYCGTNKAVALNSQTAAAELTLRVLGVGPGDEVITSAYTYTATASVIDHVGAKIVMVDTQKDSLEMDYDALEKAITEKTKVVIPIDIAGIPCDYDKIYEILERKKSLYSPSNDIQSKFDRVIVVADSAHGFGSEYKGKKSGSLADFTTFSFHAVKNLTTAEGGAVTWKDVEGLDNETLYKQYQLYSLHGQSKDALAKTQLGAWEYDVMGPWYKCNLTDIASGMGLAQLDRYEDMIERRHFIMLKYKESCDKLGVKVLNHKDDIKKSSGHLYITMVPNITLEQRNEIIIKMAEEGVSCNVHYKPLPLLTAYKNLGFDIKDYPNAYNQFVGEITLPLHTKLTDEEVEYVIEKYTEILKEYL